MSLPHESLVIVRLSTDEEEHLSTREQSLYDHGGALGHRGSGTFSAPMAITFLESRSTVIPLFAPISRDKSPGSHRQWPCFIDHLSNILVASIQQVSGHRSLREILSKTIEYCRAIGIVKSEIESIKTLVDHLLLTHNMSLDTTQVLPSLVIETG